MAENVPNSTSGIQFIPHNSSFILSPYSPRNRCISKIRVFVATRYRRQSAASSPPTPSSSASTFRTSSGRFGSCCSVGSVSISRPHRLSAFLVEALKIDLVSQRADSRLARDFQKADWPRPSIMRVCRPSPRSPLWVSCWSHPPFELAEAGFRPVHFRLGQRF